MAVFTLVLSSSLRKYVEGYDPYTGKEAEFVPPATVKDIVEQLGIPVNEVSIIMVNNAHATMDTKVSDKCRLALFPPVGGG